MAKAQAAKFGNVEFLYLPFICKESPAEVVEKLDRAGWLYAESRSKYLYPFVYKNLAGDDTAHPLMWHHTMGEASMLEIAPDGTRGKRYNQKRGNARVVLSQTHCYTFGTGVHILAFELSLLAWSDDEVVDLQAAVDNPLDNPLQVATLLGRMYYVGSSENRTSYSQGNRLRAFGAMGERGQTLLEQALKMTGDIGLTGIRFFPYVSQGSERAGVFVHVQCLHDEDLAREMPLADFGATNDTRVAMMAYLASLWNNYTRPYSPSMSLLPDLFISAPDMHWGISQDALACITYPYTYGKGRGREEFVHGALALNIEHEYQLMYVLLLHQKYAYLTMLSELDGNAWNDIDTLRDFKQRLEELHADYVFGKVSDVPQYELLYERITLSLNLSALEDDIRVPVERLARLQQAEEERERQERRDAMQQEKAQREQERLELRKEQEERDASLNFSMNLLALLAVTSAIADGKVAVELLVPSDMQAGAFMLYCLVIGVISVYAIYNLHRAKG